MQAPNLSRLKPNDRRAAEAFVENMRRELEGSLLLVALFGSKARGDDQPDSDIDFLLVTEGDPRDLERRLAAVAAAIHIEQGVLVNTLVFSAERWTDFARRRAAFWQNAQRDGMLVLRSPRTPDVLVSNRLGQDGPPDHRPEMSAYMTSAWQALHTAESEFLQGADYLVVANRAYYAVFYAANAILASRGLQRSKHAAVLSNFRDLYIKTNEIEHSYLRDYEEAMKRRHVSDYDLNTGINADFVRVGLEAAQRFLSRIERYLVMGGHLVE
jgi:uncharacterized protein (UPF0332 family)/predicted nucleotidyltransferase